MNYTQGQGLGFIPLPGERDEEHQFGVIIPHRGWVLDVDNFQTNVANFLSTTITSVRRTYSFHSPYPKP